jgi:hypothetical protein
MGHLDAFPADLKTLVTVQHAPQDETASQSAQTFTAALNRPAAIWGGTAE